MPIIGSIGAAAASGFGQRQGGKPYNVAYFVVAGGGGAGVWARLRGTTARSARKP